MRTRSRPSSSSSWINETVIGADRHATITLHLQLQATNDAAAAQIGEQSVPYNEAMQTLEILEAYTLKADGQRLPVTPDAIHEQQRRESPSQSIYNDLRQKVVIFPGIAGGDSVVLNARWRQVHHYIPGHVFVAQFQPLEQVIEEASETIVAPKDLPLYVERHEGSFEITEAADTVTYRWRYGSPEPQKDEGRLVDPDDYGPRLYVSSMRSYEDLGRAYADLVLPKVAVTPAIKALADELTMGVADRREQARRLYDWVSRNIRYVALEFGASSIIPHDAGSVLRLGYGDCKDHSVLLMALLKASGIASEIVLIDAGAKYTLSEVPRVSQFNHTIVYLPELDLYVDATAGVAPFGILPFGEYGKPVVHAVREGTVVRRTPVLADGRSTLSVVSKARFDDEGRLIEDSTVEADGPFSISYRRAAQVIQSEGALHYIEGRMRRSGYGAEGAFDFTDPLLLEPSYAIRSRITYEPRPNWLSGDEDFGMPRSFVSAPFPGDFLMGPLSQRGLGEDEPTVCYSGRVVEQSSLSPPPGKRFRALPDDIRVATDDLEFTVRWSTKGDTLLMHREFIARIDQPLCTGEIRRQAHKALIQIGEYYRNAVLSLEPKPEN